MVSSPVGRRTLGMATPGREARETTGAPSGASRSGGWRSPWEGRALITRGDTSRLDHDGEERTSRDVHRRRGLRGLRERRRQVLAERAVRSMDADAILASVRLDVRVRASRHRVALEARVGDGNHRRQQELQQDGDSRERPRQASRSTHGVNIIGSERLPPRGPPFETAVTRRSTRGGERASGDQSLPRRRASVSR